MDTKFKKGEGHISEAVRYRAKQLYISGDYRELCNFVDRLYGWGPGELDRDYTQDEALFCLRQIGIGGKE
jgi:hypothetical protein